MVRKFFYVCAGMLMLALVYHLRATTAGALASGLPVATEVSVLTGFVRNGDIIPLPTYADGTTALESECHWSLSPLYIPVAYNWCYTAAAIYGQPPQVSPTAPFDNLPFYSGLPPGRVVNAGASGSGSINAQYTIIAVRSTAQPTAARQQSWGQLKARYAPKGGSTSQPGTTDR